MATKSKPADVPDVPEWDTNPEPAPESNVARVEPTTAFPDAIPGEVKEVATFDRKGNIVRNEPARQFVERRALGRNAQALTDYVRSTPTIYQNDADAAADEIIGRTLAAETLDDILETGELTDAEEVIDINLEVYGFKANESDFQEGVPVYGVIDAWRADTQARDLIGCGAARVMAQLVRFQQLNLWPVQVRLTRAKRASSRGYFPLMFVKWK